MICAKVAILGQRPLKCSYSPSKQSPDVKVRFARLQLPRTMSVTTTGLSGRNNGVKTIVDGTAFTTTYHAYQNVLEDSVYDFSLEYPLRAAIFKHARNDKTTKYVAAQPIFYVAALKMLNTDSGYKFYLASYCRSYTCDWRDDLLIQRVVFGPTLLDEVRRLDQ